MDIDLLIRRAVIVVIAPLIPVLMAMHFFCMLVLSRSVAKACQFVQSEFAAICANWKE